VVDFEETRFKFSFVIPGHRAAMNPESRAYNLQIPGSSPSGSAERRPVGDAPE